MSAKPFAMSVKALIRDARGCYLLIRRSAASQNNAGKWDFPGGKLDPGEPFDRALIREIAEETGLTVLLETVLGAGESELPDRKVAYLFLQARVLAGELRLSAEHDAFCWLSPTELAHAELCPQFRSFAQQFAAPRAAPR